MTDDSEDSDGDKQKKQVKVMPREKVSESKSEASRDISDGLVARPSVAKNAKHETPLIDESSSLKFLDTVGTPPNEIELKRHKFW
jgi:hypothetical protein